MIGIFDSGIGGLSVLRAVRQRLPSCPILYFGDQAHVPYGPRPLAEVRSFSEAVTRFLLANGAEIVVVACNTASAAALYHLRAQFPAVPFVGMEPAVKPAAGTTHSGVVGVLATPATFQGALYASVIERFARGVTILEDTCPGLVAQIERGDLDGPDTRAILERALQPMLARGMDTVVMGCTHYPFVIPLIQEICGPGVRVIDPAPSVAQQVERLLPACLAEAASPTLRCLTSGDLAPFSALVARLLAGCCPPSAIAAVRWDGPDLTLSSLPGEAI